MANQALDWFNQLVGPAPTVEEVRESSIEDLLDPNKFSCGCTPLGHAIKRDITIEALSLWLDRAPGAISIRNKHNNVPLSQIGSTSGNEQALLIANRTPPSDMLLLDGDGDTPIHCVLQNQASSEVLKVTTARCPLEVFSTANKKGRLPIHEAIENGADVDIVQNIIERSSMNALNTPDASGRLPVHLVTARTSLTVAELLVRYSPSGALSQKDNEGMLPLHSAALAVASYENIALLVNKSPIDSLTRPDSKGRLPLHCAFDQPQRDPPRDLVDLLIGKESPHHVLLHHDEKGQSPLYLAISKQAALDVIRLMLEHTPHDMLGMNLHDGKTALSCAMGTSLSLDTVQFLLDKSPTCVCTEADNNGKHVLHYIQKPTQTEVVALLVERHPEMLLSRDLDGKLPLHYAIECDLPQSVVEMLVSKCPESLSVQDNGGRLPVHLLALASVTTQRFIVEQSSTQHLLTADHEGHLPLHGAIYHNASRGAIELLVEKCPASLLHFDDSGRLPIHHALSKERGHLNSESTIEGREENNRIRLRREMRRRARLRRLRRQDWHETTIVLAERSPDTLAMTDTNGKVLLHHICDYTMSVDLVKSIVHLCPAALQIADGEGRLPLHYALEKHWPFEAVEVLLDSFPGAVNVRDSKHRLPLYVACEAGASLDVIWRLARWAPTILSELDHRRAKTSLSIE